MTTPGWRPGPNENPDPASGYNSNVRNPPGTDPDTARHEFIKYFLWGIESDTLHTSSIGSFRMHGTVDKIDTQCKTATLNIWMSNTMDRASFGKFADRLVFRLSAMRPQHMWWNWKREFSFDGKGGYTPTPSNGSNW